MVSTHKVHLARASLEHKLCYYQDILTTSIGVTVLYTPWDFHEGDLIWGYRKDTGKQVHEAARSNASYQAKI